MPPKKRGDSSLLSPQIFAASLTKLNIRIQGHSQEAAVDVVVDQEHQLPPPNLKGVSDHEINDVTPHNGDSTAKKESKSMMSQVHTHVSVSVSAPIQIQCTKEAMEFLRQAHSQFVGLLSSELASGQDCDSDTKSKKRQKRTRTKTKTKTKTEASKDGSDDNENSIRIIVPSLIKPALERLEFHEINIDNLDDIGTDADAHKDTNDESSTKNNQTARTGTGTASSTKRSRTNQRNTSKSKASRVKKSLLNSAMTDELLKEQEKLFASSVAKAKANAK